jgi:hypothetical protein
MVAMGENLKPVQVPGLILENRTEIRRFLQALHRKDLKKYYMEEESKIKKKFSDQQLLDILKNERCIVADPSQSE